MRISGHGRQDERGLALMLVMSFMAVSFLIISGVLYSSSNAALQASRNQRYYEAQQAATAAAEFAVAGILKGFQAGGRSAVVVESPVSLASTMEGFPEWANHEFAFSVTGPPGRTRPSLIWKYGALPVTNDVYLIRAGARTLDLETPIAAVVEQEIQLAEIPLFSFMAYSEFDLTFITPPGNDITLGGRVHSNREIYAYPSGNLVFGDHVTAAGEIHQEQHPADTAGRVQGTIEFQRESDGHANALRLMPGMVDPYALLPGLAGEADLTVVISNSTVIVHNGISEYGPEYWTNFITQTNFVTGNPITFYDKRELLTVYATEFDVAGFLTQYGALGSPRLVCLDDISYYGIDTLAGFRLVNGQQLPVDGLSIVTTNALYVRGNYNTVGTVPAMLAADAVTLLSANWDDSVTGLGVATTMTLNAAIMTGTIPSDAGSGVFDGGYFNALRLLENWSGQSLTFNGAVATPFRSRHAAEPWRGGEPFFYIAPTTRVFNYETGFLTPAGLPRGTPVLHTLIRGEMVTLPPDGLF
ncbi:MAG: hypothetical protein KJ072_24215 [Verrucomicrobia bacterium]|nr:hypothetical protein [Verrucomicrobiota bacterium]